MTEDYTIVASTAEAAHLTGIKPDTVRDHLESGRWKGIKRRGYYTEIQVPVRAVKHPSEEQEPNGDVPEAAVASERLPCAEWEELIELRTENACLRDEVANLRRILELVLQTEYERTRTAYAPR